MNQLVETLIWDNPIDNSKIELGSIINDKVVINPKSWNFSNENLELNKLPLERLIDKGGQGEVYFLQIGDKKLALKRYFHTDYSNGITQFRCLRKIHLLGYETPEVYAATKDILLMDYIPYPTIREYIYSNPVEKKGRIFQVWYPQMIKIRDILWDEDLDIKDGNGYVIQDTPEVKLGMMDQG